MTHDLGSSGSASVLTSANKPSLYSLVKLACPEYTIPVNTLLGSLSQVGPSLMPRLSFSKRSHGRSGFEMHNGGKIDSGTTSSGDTI